MNWKSEIDSTGKLSCEEAEENNPGGKPGLFFIYIIFAGQIGRRGAGAGAEHARAREKWKEGAKGEGGKPSYAYA